MPTKYSADYPWFHKKDALKPIPSPWTMDLAPRKALLDDSFLEYLDMDRYVLDTYERSVAETPVLAEDSPRGSKTPGNRLVKPALVHADSSQPHGPHQHVLRSGGKGSPLRSTESWNMSGTYPGT